MAEIGPTEHAYVHSVYLGMIVVAVRARLCASLQRVSRGLELAEVKGEHAYRMVSLDQTSRVAASSRQSSRFLSEPCGRPQVGAHLIDVAQPSQGEQQIEVAAQFSAELLGALIRRFRLTRGESLGRNEGPPRPSCKESSKRERASPGGIARTHSSPKFRWAIASLFADRLAARRPAWSQYGTAFSANPASL